MKFLLTLIMWLSLGLLVLPSVFYLAGSASLEQVKWMMLAATIVWFAASIFVMVKDKKTLSN